MLIVEIANLASLVSCVEVEDEEVDLLKNYSES